VSKLTTLIFIFVSPTIAGILVIGVLAADMSLSNAMPIVIAAAVGVLAAIPVSYFIAQAIKRESQRGREQLRDAAE
jgi:membrane protein DedA with SNARE-associated domain